MANIRQNLTFLHTRSKGDIGEDIACKYLISKDFSLIKRNYQKSWGELDIIAVKDGITHFFEVKSIAICQSQSLTSAYRPEDNVHSLKIRKIRRMIQTFFAETGRGPETEFQFHVLCVFMDLGTRRARVKWIKNVII